MVRLVCSIWCLAATTATALSIDEAFCILERVRTQKLGNIAARIEATSPIDRHGIGKKIHQKADDRSLNDIEEMPNVSQLRQGHFYSELAERITRGIALGTTLYYQQLPEAIGSQQWTLLSGATLLWIVQRHRLKCLESTIIAQAKKYDQRLSSIEKTECWYATKRRQGKGWLITVGVGALPLLHQHYVTRLVLATPVGRSCRHCHNIM